MPKGGNAGAYFSMDKRRMAWVVRAATADAIDDVGRYTVRYLRGKLNVKFPPASSPGEYPRKRSGTLRDAVFSRTDRHQLVGTLFFTNDAYYWRFLEEGTSKMEPRKLSSAVIQEKQVDIERRVMRVVRRVIRQYQNTYKKGRRR